MIIKFIRAPTFNFELLELYHSCAVFCGVYFFGARAEILTAHIPLNIMHFHIDELIDVVSLDHVKFWEAAFAEEVDFVFEYH